MQYIRVCLVMTYRKDVNYWAMKQAADKSHRALHKQVKKFEAVLQSPMQEIYSLAQTETDTHPLSSSSALTAEESLACVIYIYILHDCFHLRRNQFILQTHTLNIHSSFEASISCIASSSVLTQCKVVCHKDVSSLSNRAEVSFCFNKHSMHGNVTFVSLFPSHKRTYTSFSFRCFNGGTAVCL